MRTLNRRTWLKTLAAGTALLPFLDVDTQAQAASTGGAKRVVLFCTMATVPSIWTPTSVAAENDFVLSESTSPLDAIRKHLVLVEGMPSANTGDNHGSPDGLTGLGFGASGQQQLISVDQFIADKLAASGAKSAVPSLLLGAEATAGGGKTMFNRANNLPTISSPLAAFKAVFGGSTPSPGGGGGGEQTDQLLARRKSTLDAITGQIQTLRQNVGSEAKARLDLHLESIRQIEGRLSGGSDGGGGGQIAGCGGDIVATDQTTDILKANMVHLDILASALACNATRVAGIQFGSDQIMQVNLPELNLQGDEHGLMLHSGAGDNYAKLTQLEKWLSQRFVDLVKKLEATPDPDGGGNMLDSTLVVWARDMGDGSAHNQESMRFVFAGSQYLKKDPKGRYINFRGGQRHERALLSICEAMGVTDFKGFGDQQLANKTPLSELKA
ncbi:MAG: DUF1552 domain-containing protein [Myxococcales bacterium]|nr:MAG: DUF1552 domain-containing protein [Myxococcales bacterium]